MTPQTLGLLALAVAAAYGVVSLISRFRTAELNIRNACVNISNTLAEYGFVMLGKLLAAVATGDIAAVVAEIKALEQLVLHPATLKAHLVVVLLTMVGKFKSDPDVAPKIAAALGVTLPAAAAAADSTVAAPKVAA